MERIDTSRVFGTRKPVVGMIHLEALPGAPGWKGSMEAVLDRALTDARILEDGGVDGLLVENYGDVPFVPGPVSPETVAAVSRVTAEIAEAASIPVGVNVLRNDARASLGAAVAAGAGFVRINVHSGVMFTDQGLIQGRAHETLRIRRLLDARVAVFADVLVKHAAPPPGTTAPEAALDLWNRARADALVVSGPATGQPVDGDRLARVRDAVPDAPIWIGSGATSTSARELLSLADGLIVGSAFQAGGRAGSGVELDRVRRFMDAVARARG